jgi:glycosyltransferase involved in cell wall biosynthesis
VLDKMRVLYDGWSVVYQPYGPAATHLLAVLALLPEKIEPVVALPGPAPSWFPKVETNIQAANNTEADRLQWEQRTLPKIVAERQALLLHLFSLNPPLLATPNSVVSPAGYYSTPTFVSERNRRRGIIARAREALGRGGLSAARAVFWPSDLPDPNLPGNIINLRPIVHPDFSHQPERNGSSDLADELNLPETYVLYHGPSGITDLKRLLAAWSWAAGPIGEYYPLIILGLDQQRREDLSKLLGEYDLVETVLALPDLPPRAIPYLYRGCSALFHPAPVSPWGGSVRQALASGRPVIAAESRLAGAMVGPAAYLIPIENLRQIGAALITSIVEEEVAKSLSRAALQQATSWQSEDFGNELAAAYRKLVA